MIKTILPDSGSADTVYDQDTNVTFKLSIEGQQLTPSSIFVTGDFYPNWTTGNTFNIDSLVGVHSLFNNWICSSEKKGNMASCNNYGRYIKHLNVANMAVDDKGINRDGELLFLTDDATQWAKVQTNIVTPGTPANDLGYISFCFKPIIPFNRASAPLSSDKYGNLEIQTYLTNKLVALQSDDALPALTYTVRNLKMHYLTTPDMKSKDRVFMNVYHSAGATQVSTSNFTLSKTVGGMLVDSVVGSFILKTNESNQNASYFTFDDIAMTSVEFAYNDMTNAYIEYKLQTYEEILYNALMAFNTNNMQKYHMNAGMWDNGINTGIVGVKYPSLLDMSKNKFSVTIENTNASNTNVYNAYLFFSGITEY